MSQTFKPGDRVAIYAGGRRYVGEVLGFFQGDSEKLNVRFEDGVVNLCSPEQCRRIVKKKRRQWAGQWIRAEETGSEAVVFLPNASNQELTSLVGELATLREVKQK
jgi:hypothetical protein